MISAEPEQYGENMKDVEKTNVERRNSGKRMRRRRRNMNLYAVVVIALVLTIGVTMSCTFLFNIEEVHISNISERYDENRIFNASGVRIGDNLLRLNTKKSAERILDELLYVETAEVNRKFPSALEIKVTFCVPAFNVEYSGGVLVVSRLGKILENNSFKTDGLPTICGLEPVSTELGHMIQTENEHKNEAFNEIIKSISADEECTVSSIDLNDEFAIVVNYTNGTVFKMGNWNDADYKLSLAETIMNDDTIKGKKGYLTMVGTNQCSFRTSDEPAGVPGEEPEVSTDASGNPVQPTIREEVNPEQEAIFSQFNSRINESSVTSEDTYYTGEDDYTYSEDYNYNDYYGEDNYNNYDYNNYDYDYGETYDYGNDSNDWNYNGY